MFDGFRTILSRSLVHNLYCYEIKIPNVHFEKDSKFGMSFDVFLLSAKFQTELVASRQLATIYYFIAYESYDTGPSHSVARSHTNVALGGVLLEIQPREAMRRSYCAYNLGNLLFWKQFKQNS